MGIHVTPNHFYEPIPDTRRLPDRLWESSVDPTGINLNEPQQLTLLDELAAKYRIEYESFPVAPTGVAWEYHLANDQFSKVDAEILYCMIRYLQPAQVIEIGSGYSTMVAAQAVRKNSELDSAYQCELTAIEPYPSAPLVQGFPGLAELIRAPVQEVPLARFEALQSGDVLFIDSSHVAKIGSDVCFEFLELLPRIAPGVVVQVHDIFLPAEYPRHLVVDWHRFWTEQYLLQAFLAFNTQFEVLLGASFLHLRHPDRLAAAIPSYSTVRWPTALPPSSFWFRRKLT
jgi:predicted O-methyltransferase YrrM